MMQGNHHILIVLYNLSFIHYVILQVKPKNQNTMFSN